MCLGRTVRAVRHSCRVRLPRSGPQPEQGRYRRPRRSRRRNVPRDREIRRLGSAASRLARRFVRNLPQNGGRGGRRNPPPPPAPPPPPDPPAPPPPLLDPRRPFPPPPGAHPP